MSYKLSYLFRFCSYLYSFFFFFNDTATTEIYTLSLHDALPISLGRVERVIGPGEQLQGIRGPFQRDQPERDRKSTRLNSSHGYISYAVFCLKKKKKIQNLELSYTIKINNRPR